MSFTLKAETKAVQDALTNRLPAAYAQESIPALEEIADGIIANIRRRKIFPREKIGTLQKGLWRGSVRPRKSGSEIDTGWSGPGAAFGPSHEFGYKKSSWAIKPVNVRTRVVEGNSAYIAKGQRLGKPILALRFVVNGRVVNSRGHMVSKPRVEKPHFMPAYEAYPVTERMGKALDRAIERAGL